MAAIQFSGLASGIDSAALIDAIIEARESANVLRRAEVEHIESENSALGELKTKLLALSDLIEPFRTVNGGGLSKKTNSSTATVATAAASTSAVNGSYTLTVSSLADTATGSIYHNSTTYASTSDVFDSTATGTGEITILVGTGSDQVNITVSNITATTTVQEVVDAINSDSDANGRLTAAAVNIGTSASPNYKIALTSQQAGTAKGTISVSFSALSASILYDNSDPATNAQFTIAGINGTITRATNSVSDVISGVTFQLLSNGATTISVSDDADTTADRVNEIVEAYNDIVQYINENDVITREEDADGSSPIFGSLAKTRVDDDFVTQFKSIISEAESTDGTSVAILADLGITTNRDGTLDFDADTFKSAMGQDTTGAAQLLRDFADQAGGISGTIYQFTKIQGYIDVAVEWNNEAVDNLNSAIAQLERVTAKLRENLEGQFSRLESVMAELQNKQQTLSSVLAGIQAG